MDWYELQQEESARMAQESLAESLRIREGYENAELVEQEAWEAALTPEERAELDNVVSVRIPRTLIRPVGPRPQRPAKKEIGE